MPETNSSPRPTSPRPESPPAPETTASSPQSPAGEAVPAVAPPLFQPSRRRARGENPSGSPDDAAAGSPARSEPRESDELPPPSPTTSSSPGSTDEPGRGQRVGSAAPRIALRDMPQLRDGIAQAVHAIGDELNDRVAPGTELFLTDEHDEQGIAAPASRLILRRLPPDLAASANPDFADAVEALIVIARYAVKQLNVMRALRRLRREQEQAGQVPYGTPPAAEEAA